MKILFNKCPICKKGKVSLFTKKYLKFFTVENYFCEKCDSRWKEAKDGYTLVDSKRESRHLNNTYSIDDWKNIAKKDLTLKEEKLVQLALGKLKTIPAPSSLFLEKGEKCYLHEKSSLNEPRAVRDYQSGFRGFGLPTGIKGVRFYVGRTKGRSVYSQELKTIDNGEIILTNKRIVFKGRIKTHVTPLKNIINIDAFKDAFRISKTNKQRPEVYFVEDGEIWANAIKGAVKKLKK